MHVNRGLTEELFRLLTNGAHVAQFNREKPAVSPVTFSVLIALSRQPKRGADLACLMGLDQSTVSRRIASLCEHELVERIPDPDDGRAQLVRITPTGMAVVEAERQRRVRSITNALGDWSEDERTELVRLLAHLNTTLEAYRGLPHEESRD